MDKKAVVIGIDEVGRGPIAGPVCVCAFMIKAPSDFIKAFQKASSEKVLGSPRAEYRVSVRPFQKNFFKMPLRDSKKLSAKQRELWFTQIKIWKQEGKCDFAISYVSAKQIDKIGISQAIKNALSKSLFALKPNTKITILLDGGLKAPSEFINQKTIIKGDEKKMAIALASIVAKVSRDALMKKYARKYPKHGFDLHKGYGTKMHYKAIRKSGLTPLHRASFLKKYTKR